ncbi:conserved hypothetical protein [Desulforapulum autotrophicum HRM2]|jgi:hypothetical protein|uniref:Putative heavy-metal chelation domain-containing protein n=1 Tax=Desulforapulum autotrophicum (strain ATCC 43914 / DSM 3382 / VKM B-1955 / HRM2) TaxID=177437 RepID=C0QGQ3_DESAH|nr:conserved hypothetical protein [Desulforapulum autotrophicum HRM2]
MYEKLKTALVDLSGETGLLESQVKITAKILTPKEAIGETERKDYPLLQGKEYLMQADFKGALGQAFTDAPKNFTGRVKDILNLKLADNGERALFIATLNAVMRHLGVVDKTIHCKNESPELCAGEIQKTIIEKYGADVRVGIIGFQPAIIDNFSKKVPPCNVKVTDLDEVNVGKVKYGVTIWDGRKMQEEIFKRCDVILATGSTVVNNTLSYLISLSQTYQKPFYVYGTTVSGPAKILNLERLCFQSS